MKEPIFFTTTFKLCDNNGYLSTRIRNFFEQNGHALVNNPALAGTIVISTCGFDQERENISMSMIDSLMQHYGAEKRIIICGCLPKISPDRFESSQALLIGPKELHRFNEIFNASIPIDRVSGSILDRRFIDPQYGFIDSYYIQICQGCVNNCSYCGIKKAKGTVTSKPIAQILDEVEAARKKGYRRFMLLADDCSGYGKDLKTDLAELLNTLSRFDIRFNINYLEPRGFYEVYPKIDEQVFRRIDFMNIPVQSTAKRVLELMNRNYAIPRIIDMVKSIKQTSPDTFMETHVIYGFPGETREEFNDSFRLCRVFDSVIYFYYTDRKNVKSSTLPGKMEADEIIYRTRQIMAHPNFTRDPESGRFPLVLLGYGLSENEMFASIRNTYSD